MKNVLEDSCPTTLACIRREHAGPIGQILSLHHSGLDDIVKCMSSRWELSLEQTTGKRESMYLNDNSLCDVYVGSEQVLLLVNIQNDGDALICILLQTDTEFFDEDLPSEGYVISAICPEWHSLSRHDTEVIEKELDFIKGCMMHGVIDP